jgi:DNA-directed RNA polymerase specialized sigma24 family protein
VPAKSRYRDGRSADDLLYRLDFDPYELYEIVCRLNERGFNLRAYRRRLPNDRSREMLRLRIIDGLTMREIGERAGVSRPRVDQILSAEFGLHGTPPAVKARSQQQLRRRRPSP